MRIARSLAVGFVGLALLTATATAQQGGQVRERPRQRPRLRDRARASYERTLSRLDLKAEQRTQINEKLQTYQQAVKNWLSEHGEELKGLNAQVKKALEEKDRKALRELNAKRAKLVKGQQELQEKLNLEILAVLEGEQKETFVRAILRVMRRIRPVARVRLALEVFDLKKARKELAEKILARAAEPVRPPGPREPGRARTMPLRKAIEEIKTKVLTREQAKKLDELLRAGRARGIFADLKLTPEQEKARNEILAEARKKAAGADRQDRRKIWRAAMEKIREEVLTDQQREELKNRPRRANPRRAQRRQGRRDRPKTEED